MLDRETRWVPAAPRARQSRSVGHSTGHLGTRVRRTRRPDRAGEGGELYALELPSDSILSSDQRAPRTRVVDDARWRYGAETERTGPRSRGTCATRVRVKSRGEVVKDAELGGDVGADAGRDALARATEAAAGQRVVDRFATGRVVRVL